MTSHDDDRLDLTALDPARDRARFEALVRSTVAAAMTRRRRTATTETLRWWRPALALAASLAIAAWLPALLGRDEPTGASGADPAVALLTLARSGANPSPADILATFGASR